MKRVSFQGKPHAVVFDMWGLSEIMNEAECTFGDIINMSETFSDFTKITGKDLQFLYVIIHNGLKSGALENGESFPYTPRQLSRLIPLNSDLLGEVMQEFQKGISTAIGAEEAQKPESKKKRKKQPVASQ